jgi:hypothetical protein
MMKSVSASMANLAERVLLFGNVAGAPILSNRAASYNQNNFPVINTT